MNTDGNKDGIKQCTIPLVRCSFIKGSYYTKQYKEDDIMIFKVKGKMSDDFMIKVDMFCGQDGEFAEDTEVYIGNQGTSEGAYITEATEEEIKYLHKVALNYT